MTCAYDKSYLSRFQTSFAIMLDFATFDLKIDLNTFYKMFLNSSICNLIQDGSSSVIAGKSGVELALEIIGDYSKKDLYKPTSNKSPIYWAGWALAYFHWYTSLKFAQIEKYIPIDEIVSKYLPYREMDITQFPEHMITLYNTRKKETNLKEYRLKANLSQRDLAQITSIPLRTIQQYEQRQKNINNAKAQSLIVLAKTLKCNVEDLLET